MNEIIDASSLLEGASPLAPDRRQRTAALQLPSPVKAVALPEPRVAINVRAGTMADLPFIDALMKKHSKALAFLPTNALEGKVRLGHVLIAEVASGQLPVASEGNASTGNWQLTTGNSCAGYLIGNDRYKSRDELGVIYQICVVPEYRRMLVGAHLLKARFETSAYGCKLYCCWCAQDLTSSNVFYESMGFVPIAFRAGSEKRSRVHIFWQKRIRAGDATTPWWFPSETRGGLMDAARIALPIPPGLSWRDEMPRIVTTDERALEGGSPLPPGASGDAHPEEAEAAPPAASRERRPPVKRREPADESPRGGMWFGKPKSAESAKPAKPAKAKPARVKKLAPELAAKARELRDRWSEQQEQFVALPTGKYDVGRAVESCAQIEFVAPTKALAA